MVLELPDKPARAGDSVESDQSVIELLVSLPTKEPLTNSSAVPVKGLKVVIAWIKDPDSTSALMSDTTAIDAVPLTVNASFVAPSVLSVKIDKLIPESKLPISKRYASEMTSLVGRNHVSNETASVVGSDARSAKVDVKVAPAVPSKR